MTAFMIVAAFAAYAEPDEKALLAALQGEWALEKIVFEGKELDEAKGLVMTIEKQTMTVKGKKEKTDFKWNVKASPMEIAVYEGETLVGKSIFELSGDTLKFSGGGAKQESRIENGKPVQGKIIVDERPASFDDKKTPVATFKRVKK